MKEEYLKRLDKLQRDVEWITQYLLKRDMPIQPPPYNPNDYSTRCSKCGLVFSGITGYYCQDSQCPTFAKTSCVSTSYASPAPDSYFDSIRAARGNMSNPGDKQYD